jgi:hypothetical protein
MQSAHDRRVRRVSRPTDSDSPCDGLAPARGIVMGVLGGLVGWAGIIWAVSRLW